MYFCARKNTNLGDLFIVESQSLTDFVCTSVNSIGRFHVNNMPRLFGWLVLSVVMVAGLYFVAPQQVTVAFYKLALICVAAVVGYFLDRSLFPYGRPDGYLKRHWRLGTDEPEDAADFEVADGYKIVFALSMLRRALIVMSVAISVAVGL